MAKGTRNWLVELIKWIAAYFGEDIFAFAAGKIIAAYRKYFRNRNILILGGKQTGKTSLINFLHAGKPYEETDGERRASPNPTSGAVVVDKKTKVTRDEWLKIPKDVGGERALRPLFWAQVIKDCLPEGIIYMVDGRLRDGELKKSVKELRSDVLVHFESDRQKLVAVHVFLNFADKWATSPKEVRRRIRVVEDAIEGVIDGSEALESIRFGVSETQLSPDLEEWPEANRAVHTFGAMLLEK